MKSEGKTTGEMVTSQSVSFSDWGVVYEFVQEDYTELIDFRSSEDLDAFLVFLADRELHCENTLQKTSLAPADAMRSADPFELQLKVDKVEVSRTLACNEHNIIEKNAKRNNTENSDNAFSRKRIL